MMSFMTLQLKTALISGNKYTERHADRHPDKEVYKYRESENITCHIKSSRVKSVMSGLGDPGDLSTRTLLVGCLEERLNIILNKVNSRQHAECQHMLCQHNLCQQTFVDFLVSLALSTLEISRHGESETYWHTC